MIWQTNEELLTTTLDQSVAEQLFDYLERKESQLSHQIVHLLSVLEGVPSLQAIDPNMNLSEAIEDLSRKMLQDSKPSTDSQWKQAVNRINAGLWQYVEILEGCVTELFQQLDQIGFESWNVDLIRTMTTIKDDLTNRIDGLVWAIKRLEEQLKSYRALCEKREGKWVEVRKLLYSWKSLLDSTLEPTLLKCNKFLNFRYRKFVERYTGYLQLYEGMQKQLQKFYNYRVLSGLDLNQQDKFKQLFMLLNLWEQNNKDRVLPRTETLRSLRSNATFPVTFALLKEHFSAIRKAVFDKSKLIKKKFRLLFVDRAIRQPLMDSMTSYRNELAMLEDVVMKYKKYHQQTDPTEKKRFLGLFSKRNEFDEQHINELKKLASEIKNLDLLIVNFHASLECDPALDRKITPEFQNEINRYLHEMEQPLASEDLMRRDAKLLLNALHGLDELGSFDPTVVSYIRKTLTKAMCCDWKYNVLQNMSLFHHMYHLHQGICSDIEERQHTNRLQKFQRTLDQVDLWITRGETLKYSHNIELDINDLKAYLQDFLGHVQRLEKMSEDIAEEEINDHAVTRAEQAFLEYLYVFNKFFHRLRGDNPEHRLIRKQLLFADQYFEEIERKFRELPHQ